MKVRFKKRRQNTNLIFGIFWFVLGILYLVFTDNNTFWIGYVHLVSGALFMIQNFYDSRHQYLHIENGVIQKNIFYGFSNKINLDEVYEINGTKSNYILKSEARKLSIDPSLIDQQSLIKLLHILRQVDLPSERNHFSKYKPELE